MGVFHGEGRTVKEAVLNIPSIVFIDNELVKFGVVFEVFTIGEVIVSPCGGIEYLVGCGTGVISRTV